MHDDIENMSMESIRNTPQEHPGWAYAWNGPALSALVEETYKYFCNLLWKGIGLWPVPVLNSRGTDYISATDHRSQILLFRRPPPVRLDKVPAEFSRDYNCMATKASNRLLILHASFSRTKKCLKSTRSRFINCFIFRRGEICVTSSHIPGWTKKTRLFVQVTTILLSLLESHLFHLHLMDCNRSTMWASIDDYA